MIGKVGGTDTEKKNDKLNEILTGTGFKAIASLTTDYQEMFAKAKGRTEQERQTDAMRMLREKIMDSINAAGDFAEAQKDAATASNTSSSKMTAAWERTVAGVSEKVLPKLLAFAERFSKMGGVIDASSAALGLVAAGMEQLNDAINVITGANKDNPQKSVFTNEAAREQQRADTLRGQLAKMQMRPEEIAALGKSDPAELERRRAAAMELQTRMEAAQGAANRYSAEAAKTGVGPGASPEDRAAAGRRAAGLEDAPAAGGARPVVKAELPDKEMRVRVTNPKEVGAGSGGAPAPGWTPPRG